jgi:hypothetical protein
MKSNDDKTRKKKNMQIKVYKWFKMIKEVVLIRVLLRKNLVREYLKSKNIILNFMNSNKLQTKIESM